MRSFRSFHLILVLAIGALAAPLFQSSAEPRPLLRFDALDHNRDGFLSSMELAETSAGLPPLPHADHDRDGLLDSREFQAALDAPPTQR
jgi:hypothetical protein